MGKGRCTHLAFRKSDRAKLCCDTADLSLRDEAFDVRLDLLALPTTQETRSTVIYWQFLHSQQIRLPGILLSAADPDIRIAVV